MARRCTVHVGDEYSMVCMACNGVAPPSTAEAYAAALTDEQLRAECERRWGLNAGPYREIAAERDEWKRRAENAECTHETHRTAHRDLVAARRDLDVARAKWETVKAVAIEAGLPEGGDTRTWLIAKLKRVVGLPKSAANLMRGEDPSKGIARRDFSSDNSVPFLLEDLVAEDA